MAVRLLIPRNEIVLGNYFYTVFSGFCIPIAFSSQNDFRGSTNTSICASFFMTWVVTRFVECHIVDPFVVGPESTRRVIPYI